MSEELSLNSEISPTLWPDSIVEGAPDGAAAGEMRDALASIYKQLERFHAATAAVASDPTLTEAAKVLEAEKLRTTTVERANLQWDRVNRTVVRAVQSAETRMRESVKPEHFSASGREIRDHARSLPREKRIDFLQSAARRGDRETVHAIVSTLPYLSGLEVNEEQWQALKTNVYRALSPELAEEVDRLRHVESKLTGAMGAFAKRYYKADPRAASIAKHVERRLAAV